MADFNQPTNTTTYTNVLTNLNDKIASVSKMDFTGDTNIPTNAIRISGRQVERWSGTVWNQVILEPAGIIKAYAGASAPAGHLLCLGQAVSRTTYATLFGVLGTAYGAGDGSTTFNLPNLQQRFPLGKAASGTGNVLGATGGAIDHTHTVKKHYHFVETFGDLKVDIAHSHGDSAVTGTVGGADGGHSHAITDPGHTHNTLAKFGGSNGSESSRAQTASLTTGTNANYPTSSNTTGISITSVNSGHGHGFSLTASGQSLGASERNIAGFIGPRVTSGGVSGDVDQASGPANPPYQVVNYIITT